MNKKILIFGDDPRACTGFGNIVDHLVDAVASLGDIPIVVGLKSVSPVDYPKAVVHNAIEKADTSGFPTFEKILAKENPTVVISIGDPWDLQGIVEIKKKHPFFWIGYTPVESTPYSRYILLSHKPQQYLDAASLLTHMDHIVTYSDFGKIAVSEMLNDNFCHVQHQTPPQITKIYLGVDADLFVPKDKVEARKVFGGKMPSDTLLFSCVKVNSMRAGFDTLFEAWSKYMIKAGKTAPGLTANSKLYLHTNISGSGYPLSILMKRYGIEDSIVLNPAIGHGKGFPVSDMIDMYNSTDITVSATRGEGFGLNILESLSCKVPCIVPNCGCPAEYGGKAVNRVPIAATYNPDFASTDFSIVDTEAMSDMMLTLAVAPKKRMKRGEEGQKIAKSMSWEVFIDKWQHLLKNIL
jgi:glycosyltransferase involved in cell wall biosynthesis